jgi:hypothetical protein
VADLTLADSSSAPLLQCRRGSTAGRRQLTVLDGEDSLFTATAASMFVAGAGYDVTDCASGTLIGIVARQAAKSLLWDSWLIYGPDGTELARVSEDSAWKYVLRRFLLGPLLPMSHAVYNAGGMRIAQIRELVGWFARRHRLTLDSPDGCPVDFRLLLTVAMLLAIVQARAEAR